MSMKPRSTDHLRTLRLIDFQKQRRDAERKETMSILAELLGRSIRGEVIGIALCFRAPEGEEHCLFTGSYKANLALAMNASVRMEQRLMDMQDAMV